MIKEDEIDAIFKYIDPLFELDSLNKDKVHRINVPDLL